MRLWYGLTWAWMWMSWIIGPRPILGGWDHCLNGTAGGYGCNGYDLMGRMGPGALGLCVGLIYDVDRYYMDVWGWTDVSTGRSYGLVTVMLLNSNEGGVANANANRIAVVDVTNPLVPACVGYLEGGGGASRLRTYGDYGYYVDAASGKLRIVNLSASLRPNNGVMVAETVVIRPVAEYALSGNGNANSADFSDSSSSSPIDESSRVLFVHQESGYLYAWAPCRGGRSSSSRNGMLILDVQSNPTNLREVGCIDDNEVISSVECVHYVGPDVNYVVSTNFPKEICFASVGDALVVYDVSTKSNVQRLSKLSINQNNMLQGSLNAEQKKFYFVDARRNGAVLTIQVTNLTQPYLELPVYFGPVSPALKRSIFVAPPSPFLSSDTAYLVHGEAGLRVLHLDPMMEEVGFFQTTTVPATDGGTTSLFMFSGSPDPAANDPASSSDVILLLTSRDEGLFLVSSTTVTDRPSLAPTSSPSTLPTAVSSVPPTGHPTGVPSSRPTGSRHPSGGPSVSIQPTERPSTQSSSHPSTVPTDGPTAYPTLSIQPTSSLQPTLHPSDVPTGVPSTPPSHAPTHLASELPTDHVGMIGQTIQAVGDIVVSTYIITLGIPLATLQTVAAVLENVANNLAW